MSCALFLQLNDDYLSITSPTHFTSNSWPIQWALLLGCWCNELPFHLSILASAPSCSSLKSTSWSGHCSSAETLFFLGQYLFDLLLSFSKSWPLHTKLSGSGTRSPWQGEEKWTITQWTHSLTPMLYLLSHHGTQLYVFLSGVLQESTAHWPWSAMIMCCKHSASYTCFKIPTSKKMILRECFYSHHKVSPRPNHDSLQVPT